jgi:tRNA pseudouridine32 synthase/23S rRNA pseudouridine746 synthase
MPNFLQQTLIHRDEHFIVINKPAGLLSVPGKGDLTDCVIARLLAEEPNTLLIHRLDRDTSGILVFALNKAAQSHISRQFQNRQTEKQYHALVGGVLTDEGSVDVPVNYDPTRPPLHIADPAYHKPALTHWQALELFNINGQAVTRVKLMPITGRSHQLRVHMQYLGHAIVGDGLYASEVVQQLMPRLCLHAEQLSFLHPVTGEALNFFCPAPF